MRGKNVSRTWRWNPALYAPARYRRACRYEAFLPDPLAGAAFQIRQDHVGAWVARFAAASARAARLADEYLEAVNRLMGDWRTRLSEGANPRADAAAWALIDALPAHPVVTTPVAAAATGRARAAIHQAVDQLEECGVLEPLSDSRRNRSWEVSGLLALLEDLEAGKAPDP